MAIKVVSKLLRYDRFAGEVVNDKKSPSLELWT